MKEFLIEILVNAAFVDINTRHLESEFLEFDVILPVLYIMGFPKEGTGGNGKDWESEDYDGGYSNDFFIDDHFELENSFPIGTKKKDLYKPFSEFVDKLYEDLEKLKKDNPELFE